MPAARRRSVPSISNEIPCSSFCSPYRSRKLYFGVPVFFLMPGLVAPYETPSAMGRRCLSGSNSDHRRQPNLELMSYRAALTAGRDRGLPAAEERGMYLLNT